MQPTAVPSPRTNAEGERRAKNARACAASVPMDVASSDQGLCVFGAKGHSWVLPRRGLVQGPYAARSGVRKGLPYQGPTFWFGFTSREYQGPPSVADL